MPKDNTADTPAELAELRTHAEKFAREAGALIRDDRPASLTTDTKSSATDVVTIMDTASEDLLVARILETYPDDGILGEERGARPTSSGRTWVIDPIDGTVNYLYGLPAYAVSVAVVSGMPSPGQWLVLAGCVYQPESDDCYTAAVGAGACLNEHRLAGPASVDLHNALVGTGFGYTVERRAAQAQVVAHLVPKVRDIRRIGAAALDLCAVASGTLDAYYEWGLQPWDLAAGELIAREAGAHVTGLHAPHANESMTVAGSELLVQHLRDELTDAYRSANVPIAE